MCRPIGGLSEALIGGQLSEFVGASVRRLSALSEDLGQFLSLHYVGLSELCQDCVELPGR